MNFNVLVAIILILIFIAAQPSVALFFLALAYVVSGPLAIIRTYNRESQSISKTSDASEHG
jgi:phosphatidylserine synthase